MKTVANITLSQNLDRKTTPNGSLNGGNTARICDGPALEITAGNYNPPSVPDAVAILAPADNDAIFEVAGKDQGEESP